VVIAACTVAVAIALVWGLTTGKSDTTADPRDDIPAEDVCADAGAQPIELNAQVVDPPALTCFTLSETSDVSVGAAALDPEQPISLEVRFLDDTVVGGAVSAPGIDPVVSASLPAGTYITEVTAVGGGAPPGFLLFTTSFPVGALDPAEPGVAASDIPAASECGGAVPWLAHGDRLERDADAPFACLDVTESAFIKVGAQSEDPLAEPDLRLSLYRTRGDDGTTLIRTTDDAFGWDPEMSIDVEPGIYVVAVDAWFSAATDDFTLYLDTQGEFWRTGAPTPQFSAVSPSLCDDASMPSVSPGSPLTVDGERQTLCMSVPSTGRYTLALTSRTDQNLAIEVLDFDDSGAPQRIAYSDDNPYDPTGTDVNPVIDLVWPEGEYVLGVFSWFGGVVPADYDLSFEQTGPRD
jgi:hypothetical protein